MGEAVPLLGQRAQRLGEQLEGVHPDRDLACAGAEETALHPDPVADVQQLVAGELRPQVVGAEVELDAAAPVQQVAEARLAVPAQAHDAARDPHPLARIRCHGFAAREQVPGVVGDVVAVGVRLDAGRPPARELLAPLAHEFLQRHGESPGTAGVAEGVSADGIDRL